MTDIIAEKFERECQWNAEKVRGRKKIFDYRILIDGEHRVTYTQAGTKPGEYHVREPDGEGIRIEGSSSVLKVISDDLQNDVADHLARGWIPSIAELQANAAKRAEVKRERDEAAEKERRDQLVRDAAHDLLAALKAIVTPTGFANLDAGGFGTHGAALAAIAKAEG